MLKIDFSCARGWTEKVFFFFFIPINFNETRFFDVEIVAAAAAEKYRASAINKYLRSTSRVRCCNATYDGFLNYKKKHLKSPYGHFSVFGVVLPAVATQQPGLEMFSKGYDERLRRVLYATASVQ